ncbi:hypothetical protein M3Y99_00562700 [Aphelenchoides fujianensis]|nr:hypothetical protein M3Y99_00562700 [Aphelenchoides fujianensis]
MTETQVRRKDDEVSGGGMASVFMGSRWRRFCFWTLIFILTVLTIKDVLTLFWEYKENEKEADMNIVFNQTMTLPTFTFCVPMGMVQSVFESSKFKEKDDFGAGVAEKEAVKKALKKLKTGDDLLTKKWDRKVLKQSIESIGLLHSLERETDDSFVAREISVLNKKEKSKEKLKTIEKSVRLSMIDDKTIASGFKTTWISMGDICFQPTFEEEGASDIETQGHFYEILFNHDPQFFDDKMRCVMVDMNGRPADMSRFQDSGGHTKDGLNEDICAGTDNDLIVELRAAYQMLENDDPGTACAEFEDEETAEDEFDCRSRCRMELIRSICQCSPLTTQALMKDEDSDTFPPCSYSNCSIDVQKAPKSEKSCTKNCRRNCKQLRYNINLGGDVAKAPHQTRARIAWGSFEYFRLEQNYKYESLVNFMADVGGAIGIWLGLSILTCIQGAMFFAEFVTAKFSQNPIGDAKLSANPFGDFKEAPRKRSTTSANLPPP